MSSGIGIRAKCLLLRLHVSLFLLSRSFTVVSLNLVSGNLELGFMKLIIRGDEQIWVKIKK